MYIDNSGGRYYRGTEQCTRKASFLILMGCNKRWGMEGKDRYAAFCPMCPHRVKCNPEKNVSSKLFSFKEQIRGIVRKVALQQLGHFMMGRARIKNTSITLSGSYGGDGLPKEVDPDIYILGTPLPDELFEAWNHGGGHNACGSEAPKMAEWAKTL